MKESEILTLFDEIERIIANIKEYSGNPSSSNNLENLVVELDNKYNELEALDLANHVLAKEVNNKMHELEKEIKVFFTKLNRIQSFERQLEKHEKALFAPKERLIKHLNKKQVVPKSLLDEYRDASTFFAQGLSKNMEDKYAIDVEIEKIEQEFEQLKKKLNS